MNFAARAIGKEKKGLASILNSSCIAFTVFIFKQ